MNNEITRICCDVCGAYLEFDGEKFAPIDDDGCCVECGSYQVDEAFLNPDQMGLYGPGWLNFERFGFLWNLRMLPKKGYMRSRKPYDIWRNAHPELEKPFNMCSFKEKPDMEQRLLEVWDVPDEDEDEENDE